MKTKLNNEIPELEPHCGSWIITSPSGLVSECFKKSNVERAAKSGFKIETAAQYLGRINQSIKRS